MNKITDFHKPEDSSFVGWIFSGAVVKKLFNYNIYALLLKSEQKVLVVELNREKENAIIYNADGSELKQITNPDTNSTGFGDAYYVNEELTLISRRKDASMLAVVIDENGEIVRTYETR
jgi:hypothetical protein